MSWNTRDLQNRLKYKLEHLFSEWKYPNLEVFTEDKPYKGKFPGRCDIGIADEHKAGKYIAIEIEHANNPSQVITNVKKLYWWSTNGPNRRAGLLQVFSDSGLNDPKMFSQLNEARKMDRDSKQFFYEYDLYTTRKNQSPEGIARLFIKHAGFQTRLWWLLCKVGLVEY